MDKTAMLVTILTAILSCSGTSTIVLYFLRKHDKTATLARSNERQAEGINVLAKAMLDLTNALHAKGIINGESEQVRADLEGYLYKCTAKGMYSGDKEVS